MSDRIGVMGGTFDPIHIGHLLAAEQARQHLQLEKVLFIPTGLPPHKVWEGVSPAEDRYAMTVLATSENPHFLVSRMDMERQGPSFTVDTLRRVQELYPTAEVWFITGADAAMELLTWKDPEILLSQYRFLAVTRPGFDLAGLEAALGPWAKQIQTLEIPELDISSTELRDRISKGLSVRYMVPEGVRLFIEKRSLYHNRE